MTPLCPCGGIPQYASEDGRTWCKSCFTALVDLALEPGILTVEELEARLRWQQP